MLTPDRRAPSRPDLDRATLDLLPDLVWWTSSDGQIVEFNAASEAVIGLPRRATLQDVLERIHPDDVIFVAERWDEAVRTGCAYSAQYRVRRNGDADYRWTMGRALPIRDVAGVIVSWLGVNVDIDGERREIESLERRWHTIADALPSLIALVAPDGELLYVNRTWREYTGLDGGLQGDRLALIHPADRDAVVAAWQRVRESGTPTDIYFRLRGTDGRYRWFLNRSTPMRAGDGTIDYWIASMTDVDDRKRSEDALRVLAHASDVFSSTLDVDAALERLGHVAVEYLADWCAVYVFDDAGVLRPATVLNTDPTRIRIVRDYLRRYPIHVHEAVVHLARTALAPSTVPAAAFRAQLTDDEHRAAFDALDLHAIAFAPLYAGEERYGILTLATSPSRGSISEEDLVLTGLIAQRASVAIGNARAYERQRQVAATLQASFLPARLPVTDGAFFDASYTAGTRDLTIGGDWYDAFADHDGTIAFSVGDVAGRGLSAAVVMGKMRQTFRALAEIERDPARALLVADSVLRREHPDVFVTAFLAALDPGKRVVRYANAGHPQPYVRHAGGTLMRPEGTGVPLGVGMHGDIRTRQLALHEGDVFVVFTDGLIERTHDISAGEARVEAALAHPAFEIASAPATLLHALCINGVPSDDVAILALRTGGGASWTFDANDPVASTEARRAFAARLAHFGVAAHLRLGAEVVFGELTGNAARHTPGPLDIGLRVDDAAVVLAALDRGSGYAWRPWRPADEMAEGGRGLFLIGELANDVSVEHIAGFGSYIEVTLAV